MPERALRGRPRRRGWACLVPATAAVAGLLLATSARTAVGTDLRSAEGGDLATLIRSRIAVTELKAREVQRLRTRVWQLTGAAAPATAGLGDLQKRGEPLAADAGMDPVSGPLIRVSLDDAKRSAETLPKGFTADDLVVHQQDVQAVVNALRAGGAEAMMLQDQRVIASSAVRCAGNTLILQGRVYSPPYVVQAIGDVSRMRQSLQRSPSVAIFGQYVAAVGLGYDVGTRPRATFPAYGGTVSLRWARAGTSRG